MCKSLHHLSRYCTALNLTCPAFTLSPTFSNFRSSLQQMELTPSQVRNHYSPKNLEAHQDGALAFKKATNLHCPSNVCSPIFCLRASYCRWLISPISLMYQVDEADQQISNDNSEDTGESTVSSDIEEDDSDHQQEVLHLVQVCWDKSLRTTRVPLPKTQSHADTVIAPPPLPNSRNLPAAMAPLLLKRQKSSLFNNLPESDSAPSTRALVLPNKCSRHQNIPQPKASSDQNVPQQKEGTFDVVKRFMKSIVFRMSPWPIISNDKYSMIEGAWKLAIDAQDLKRAVAGAPVCTPSVCQLPGGPPLKIDPQTREAVSLGLWLMLLYHTYGYWLPPKIYIVETED